MKRLKAAGAVAAEVIVGQRRVIKPSRKAKAAAGIVSGEDDQTSDPEDTEEIGGKRKKSATTKARTSESAPKPKAPATSKSAPKPKARAKKRAKKAATVDSDDEANGDEEEGDAEGEDQVDEYERLREQRETDRPVSHNVPRS
jgi:hypothetical protein